MITEVKVGDILEYDDRSRQYLCVVLSSYYDGMNRESFDVMWLTEEAIDKCFAQKHYVLSTVNNQKYADWRKVS